METGNFKVQYLENEKMQKVYVWLQQYILRSPQHSGQEWKTWLEYPFKVDTTNDY